MYQKEQQVNALQVDVDDTAVKLTTLQQPVASDARFLFMASRIGGELERIADQSINIVQNTHYVLGGPAPVEPLVDLSVMADRRPENGPHQPGRHGASGLQTGR